LVIFFQLDFWNRKLSVSDYESFEIIERNPKDVYPGMNFFHDRRERKVFLMENSGSVVHQWDVDKNFDSVMRFNYPLIWENGDLIYTDNSEVIVRFDKKSNVVWKNRDLGHHDTGVFRENLIASSRKSRYSDLLEEHIEDEVLKRVAIDTGEVFDKEVSLYEVFESSNEINLKEVAEKSLFREEPLKDIYLSSDEAIKLFHLNSITVLDKDYDDIFIKDRILLSLRNIDMIILFDFNQEEIVWFSDVDLDRPHHPTMTEGGNILIFDNGLEKRDYSRILEINPENEIVWSYNKAGTENFHSEFMGSAQELPNGNILISESMKNRAFEINRSGEVVWKLPEVQHGGIYRFTRFETECIKKVLNGQKMHSEICY